METADVLVVGSGQAGVPLALRLAATGRRVVLFERGDLGGTCVNVGCTPTKTMVASARAAHVARQAARLGVHVGDVEVDLAEVVARKDAVVARWRAGVQKRLSSAGERLRLVRAHARFVGPRTLEANGESFRAETVVLDVGARPGMPHLPGIEEVRSFDNGSIMQLRERPAHLVVLGGGFVGCEFAQMFRRFGSAVTIVDSHDHVLAQEDADVAVALESSFAAEGIAIAHQATAERVRRDGDGVIVHLADGREIAASHLLLAVGRRPNTDDLGCEAGGIALDAHGFVVTDEAYGTSATGVYAVGDVTGEPEFTHTAWDDHRLLFDRLQGKSVRRRSERYVPFTVFTDPQVAGVGPTEREARERGLAFEVATMDFGAVARAIETDETAGTMKLLVDPHDERVVGARIVGAEAGELIHVFVTLMQAGASVRAVAEAEFVHPTFAEGVQSLVMRLPRFALS
jgi:pyruvate/2-oxoglutarate dehydrogenase complex dihydrolipoamide dehydrogenase (E3) component